jgi:hypothetical protein
MLNKAVAQLKLEIQNEERLYNNELKTTQQYHELKVIRLRIKELKQRLTLLEGELPDSESPLI